jgi:hypothetical protein
MSGCRGKQGLIAHSYTTNYMLGETKTVYTGQSIVKIKDYYVNKSYEPIVLTPSVNFKLEATVPTAFSEYLLNISGLRGTNYDLYEKLEIAGEIYSVIYITDASGYNTYGIIVDKHGMIKDNSIYRHGIIVPTKFKLEPANVVLNKLSYNYDNLLCDTYYYSTNKTCGFNNYELIYGGINNVSMNITYREYTRDDHAKPSFYQNLTFETNAKQIRFKDIIIEVIEASNEKLVYKVSSDGLKQTEFMDGVDPVFEQIKYRR